MTARWSGVTRWRSSENSRARVSVSLSSDDYLMPNGLTVEPIHVAVYVGNN